MRITGTVMFCACWILICLLTAFNPLARAQETTDLNSDSSAVLWPGNVGGTNSIQNSAVTSNSSPQALLTFVKTNFLSATNFSGETMTNSPDVRLATARYLEKMRQPDKAEPILVSLLAADMPESIQKSALFELGVAVAAENDLPRAQTIFTQYLDKWAADVRVPEALLRQGQIFRQMGLNDLALAKFYSVMTSALSLKDDQLAYYQRLVLQAQVEIAETHYLMGKFSDAADFYSRLLQKNDPSLNRPQIQFRLIRSLIMVGHNAEAGGQAQDFISRFPGAPEEPEVRYYLAQSLKALGRNSEALQQVLLFLQEQKIKTKNQPEVWAYWQQRVGNEIANELYKEGDYVKALEIYTSLSKLDSTPDWQLPVYYQMGITYERLLQPQKAIDAYNDIIARQSEVGTNATPGLKTVFDMARWRVNFLKWQDRAEAANTAAAKSAADYFSTNTPPKTLTQ